MEIILIIAIILLILAPLVILFLFYKEAHRHLEDTGVTKKYWGIN